MEDVFFKSLGCRFGILLALISFCHAADFSYTPYWSAKPILLLEMDFKLTISALKDGQQIASIVQDSSHRDKINVFGVNGPRSLLRLRFSDLTLSWTFIFNEVSEEQITLGKFIQFEPARVFPQVTELSNEVMFHGGSDINLHSARKSFACNSSVTTHYTTRQTVENTGGIEFKVSVTMSNLKTQAYNIENGHFSPPLHCSEDATSTTTTATPTTTVASSANPKAVTTTTRRKSNDTTTSSKITTTEATTTTTEMIIPQNDLQLNSYVVYETVDNNTIACVSLIGKIGFEISYRRRISEGYSVKDTITLGIPDGALTEGYCHLEPATQMLTIRFYNSWSIEFMITVNDETSVPHERGDAQSKLDYSIRAIKLNYKLDKLIFPNVAGNEGANYTVRNPRYDHLPRKKTARQFFLCQSTKRYQMDDNVVLLMSGIKFKAFIHDQDIYFYGLPDLCQEDTNNNHHPIVVVAGSLVVTCSIMILIACTTLLSVKCSFRKRRGYRPL